MERIFPFGFLGDNCLCDNGFCCSQISILHNNSMRLIQCNKNEKTIRVCEKRQRNEEWTEMYPNHLLIIVNMRINEENYRWEGDFLDDKPFGYGCIYNPRNQLVYKGFMYEGKKVCFGTEFYGESGTVEYEGGFYDNMRHGQGKYYNNENQLVYEGEWFMSHSIDVVLRVDNEFTEDIFPNNIEIVIIGADCHCNMTCFRLVDNNHIKILGIGKNFMSNRCDSFVICNCGKLVEVRIDDHCFCNPTMNPNSNLSISNCNNLKTVEFGEESFQNLFYFSFQSMFEYMYIQF